MIQLVSKSSTGKLRILEYDFEKHDDGNYTIYRYSYQYGGKKTQQPSLEITEGKAARSRMQQCELEYNHLIKHAKDKGYKVLSKDLSEYTSDELNNIVGMNVTSSDGIPKPMLCKQADKVTNKKIFDKEYYASTKIDGLRILIYQNEKGELHTASRGAINYDPAMYEILTHPTLIQIFNENPGLIMDGEGYKHNHSLQYINKIARTQVKATDYDFMQFYWYDVIQTDKPFTERLSFINDISNKYNLSFDPNKEFKRDELRIQVVPHIKISGYDNMMLLHDEFTSQGWEGLVIRLANSVYQPNARNNNWIKIKKYQDDEFKVIGYELGLRGIEDMVFKCVTKYNKEFLAKPIGDRNIKQWYVDNFETECLNKLATVKYFYYSEADKEEDRVPLQPVMLSITDPKE